jgi:hypothetical protein
LTSAVLLRNAPTMAREFSARCTAADLAVALRVCLRAVLRSRPGVAARFAFNAALRLAARFELPWTANER